MPIQTTYPGVYIQEISSGVHTITGVSTSITAFVGRALRGPTNDSVSINSFADFERRFGGLGADYPMSYAVRDFYLNGGTQAIIVRLFQPTFADEAARQNAFDAAKTQANTAAAAVATAAQPARVTHRPAALPRSPGLRCAWRCTVRPSALTTRRR